MYVISILFIATNLLFSQDNNTANIANSASGVVSTIQTNNAIKLLNQEAIQKQEAELKAMGIETSQCDGWRGQRNKAQGFLKKNNLANIISGIDAGSCANPSDTGTSAWNKFITAELSAQVNQVKESCCYSSNVTSFTDVDSAYKSYYTNCDKEAKAGAATDCPAVKGKETLCYASATNYVTTKKTQCENVYKKIKDQVNNRLESNCDKCKAYKSAKSSFWETVGLGTQLANLANQIFGKDDDELTDAAKLSCEQKCSKYTGQTDLYKACLCSASYTLSDGSSQPCKMEAECKEDTSCSAKRASMEKMGYCSGEDCEDIEASCKCTEVSTAMGGSTKRWDPVNRKCVNDADGTGDNSVTYTTPDDPKYNVGDSAKASTPADSSTTASGSGSSLSSVPNASGTSVENSANKTPANEKDKSKFGTLSNKAGSQFKNNQGQLSMGEYGTGEQGSPSSSNQVPVDIIESKGPDIWKIIRDIYQTGIDANRFMGTNTVSNDKSAIKKNKKKNKGKKA